MKNPLHATLTTPPLVEYVADGCVVGGLVGRVASGAGGGGAVGGAGGGGTGAPGCATCALGVVVTGAVGLGATGPPPRDGTVELELPTLGAVLVGAAFALDGGDASALTTSSWASTGAGRSVTSAATIDVAAHTMAVDATVTANHSPLVNSRDGRTCRGCTFGAHLSAKRTSNRSGRPRAFRGREVRGRR
jgi:hypothetical protein